MKQLIVMMALASGLSFTAAAQNDELRDARKEQKQNMSPDERAAKDAAWAESKLGLNADQKSKWQQASIERINANAPLREKMRGSTTPEEREQLRKEMKANGDKFDATVTAFLTAEQKTKYTDARRHHHDHGGMMRPMKKDKSAGQPNMSAPR